MYQTFSLPTKVISGSGCLRELPEEVKRLGNGLYSDAGSGDSAVLLVLLV